MSTVGRQHDPNSGVRRVVLTTLPALHPFSLVPNAPQNYFCYGHDMKGFQIEIDLQALPPGVTINQLAVNQVWWVEKRTSLYRIYLYGGVYDPVTRQINTTAPLPTPTVSGNYLPISGGTISGNLTVTGTATLQGGLYVTSPLVGGVTATNGQSLVYNGTQWAPATISGGTASGNYLPISGGTVSGNLVVASGLTVSGSVTGQYFSATGLTGATTSTRYVGATTNGPPLSGSFLTGDFIVDQYGKMWVCTGGGTPGSWQSVGNGTVGTTGNITASGSTQFSSSALAYNYNIVSGATATTNGGAGTGVILPFISASGQSIWVDNTDSTHWLKIYPSTGQSIDSAGANNPVWIAPSAYWLGIVETTGASGNWASAVPSLNTDSSGIISVSYVNGQITFGITGVIPIANGGTGATTAISGFNALAATGGTVGGNLVVASGLTVSGATTVNGILTGSGGITTPVGVTASVLTLSGGLNIYGGTTTSGYILTATSPTDASFKPAPVISGSYLPISGGTISGNLTVASGLTVSGALTVGSEVDTGAMTVGGNLTVTGTTTLYNTLSANSGINLAQATNVNFSTGGGFQLTVSGSNPGTIIIPGPGLGSTDTLATLNGTQTLSNKTLATTTVSGNLVVASGLTVSGTVTATGIQITESQVTNLTTDLSNRALTTTIVTGTVGQITGGGTLASNQTFGLATAGTAGTYGTSSGIPIITTDAYGRVTNVTVTGVASTGGGSYLPISGGTISGNLVVANGFTVSGTTTLNNTLAANSGITLGQATNINFLTGGGFQLTVSGSSPGFLILPGPGTGATDTVATLNGTQTLTNKTLATTTVSGNLTVASGLTVTGTTTHIGNATFSGNVNISGTLTVSGAATLNGTAIPLSQTLLYAGGPLGTPSSATLTNATGLPVAGLNPGATGSVLISNASGPGATSQAAWTSATSAGAILYGSQTNPSLPVWSPGIALSVTGAILYALNGAPTWNSVGATGNVLQLVGISNNAGTPTWVPIGTANNKYLAANLSLAAATATGVVSITGTSTGSYQITGQALVAYTSAASTVDIWFGTTSGSVTGGVASSSTNVNSTTTYASVSFSTIQTITSGTIYWLNAYATGACTLRYLSVSESIINATGLTTYRIS